MATPRTDERLRWPGGLLAAAAVAILLAALAWILVEAAAAAAVGLLAVLVIGGLAAGRAVNRSNPHADTDADDPIPRQPAHRERPLGDTRDAHDELSPHDLPGDHPGRKRFERQTGARAR